MTTPPHTNNQNKARIRQLTSERDALHRDLDEARTRADRLELITEDQLAHIQALEGQLREANAHASTRASTIHFDQEVRIAELEQIIAELQQGGREWITTQNTERLLRGLLWSVWEVGRGSA